MNARPLPIGVDDFEEMIQKGYYYADKTLMIRDLLDLDSKVTLITRPRRFGKSLNMS
ncbi:MAG: AAA family ATPase, partial [Lachnospiraceae bacterium]|nr:AAA family ATPase [Lachnospiraceae bacterium]